MIFHRAGKIRTTADGAQFRLAVIPGGIHMAKAAPSALITDKGQRVQLRLQGQYYDLSHQELCNLHGLPAGAPGLGISIDSNRLRFEFTADQRTVEMSAAQLQRRLARKITTET